MKPKTLAKLVEPRVLTHILRGLLAADHVVSLHHLKTLNAKHVRAGSVAQARNLATLAGAVWGFLYEAADALGKLNGLKIRAMLTDRKAWDDLEAMRKRWSSGNQFTSRVRNNISFHLGYEEFYVAGLAELARSNRSTILFEMDGDSPSDLRWHLPQSALFQGLGLTSAAILAFTEAAQHDAAQLGNRLNRVLVDLLRQGGVRFPPGAVAMGEDDDDE